jgi:hypothetical protein
MLRANACKGSLTSKPTKSSNLTGKNSFCVLITGHHKYILTKYMTGLGKLYNSTFPPLVPPSFTSSLNVSDYLFPGDPSQAQANTQGILCLEEGYLFVGRYGKRTWYRDCHAYTQTILKEIAQLIPSPEHISFCSQLTGTVSHRDKREVTLIVLGITALITALAEISYGVIANHVTAKNLTKVVEDTSDQGDLAIKDIQRSLSFLPCVVMDHRLALDFLLTKQGGICAITNTSCCAYINTSGIVEEHVDYIL